MDRTTGSNNHGFTKPKSTETQIPEPVKDWTLALDQKKGVHIIHLDFMKAFDEVPHSKLLTKSQAAGLNGALFK